MLVAQCNVDDELSNFDCVEPTLGLFVWHVKFKKSILNCQYIILQILAFKMLGYLNIFFFYKGDLSSLKHLYLNICESRYIITSRKFIYINFKKNFSCILQKTGPYPLMK